MGHNISKEIITSKRIPRSSELRIGTMHFVNRWALASVVLAASVFLPGSARAQDISIDNPGNGVSGSSDPDLGSVPVNQDSGEADAFHGSWEANLFGKTPGTQPFPKEDTPYVKSEYGEEGYRLTRKGGQGEMAFMAATRFPVGDHTAELTCRQERPGNFSLVLVNPNSEEKVSRTIMWNIVRASGSFGMTQAFEGTNVRILAPYEGNSAIRRMGDWNTIRVEREGNNVKGFVNDSLIARVTNNALSKYVYVGIGVGGPDKSSDKSVTCNRLTLEAP